MTIGIGVVCKEGVLLCADTEQTAWAMKLHGSKLGHFDCPGGTIAFAYAGNTRFAFSAIQKLQKHLQAVPPTDTLQEMEKLLDKEYRRNVLKHPGHTTDASLPYQLLLAIWSPQGGVKLYVTAQTAIQHVDGYECIGIGDYLAHYLIRPTFIAGMVQREAVALCAYAMTGIKDYVSGCGGLSVYVLLQNDGKVGLLTSLHDGPCEQLQRYSKAYDHATRELLLTLVNEDANDADFERYLTETFNKGLLKVRREWTMARREREAQFVAANPKLPPEEAKRAFRLTSMGLVP